MKTQNITVRACAPRHLLALPLLALAAAGTPAQVPGASDATAAAWQACVGQGDAARLACFDAWAASQPVRPATADTPSAPAVDTRALRASPAVAEKTRTDGNAGPSTPAQNDSPSGPVGILEVGLEQGCRDHQYSAVSRFWELESGSSCPTLGLRSFHPSTVAFAFGSRMNHLPQSPNPIDSATTPNTFQKRELRFTLSIRTKIAAGLLTPRSGTRRDSLWLGYTQQSYWQMFNGAQSRPFRNTDYMPEIMYVYPTTLKLPGGWAWRYSGIGLAHQSNGKSDPLSRSWNRAYLMAGFEQGDRFNLQLRLWHRIHESAEKDNNPDITRRIGQGDLTLGWNIDQRNTVRATYTGSFTRYGSTRLEWTHTIGKNSGLRFYTGLFNGYGDSLIDYNYRRTVLTFGLSLVDF